MIDPTIEWSTLPLTVVPPLIPHHLLPGTDGFKRHVSKSRLVHARGRVTPVKRTNLRDWGPEFNLGASTIKSMT
jgi:hypothetical protein